MKRINLAAALILLGVCAAWTSAIAAERASLGQPVIAVPRANTPPTQYREANNEGRKETATGFDSKRPDLREREGGPSKAFLEEQESARRWD